MFKSTSAAISSLLLSSAVLATSTVDILPPRSSCKLCAAHTTFIRLSLLPMHDMSAPSFFLLPGSSQIPMPSLISCRSRCVLLHLSISFRTSGRCMFISIPVRRHSSYSTPPGNCTAPGLKLPVPSPPRVPPDIVPPLEEPPPPAPPPA
jgi:hypothetical protein